MTATQVGEYVARRRHVKQVGLIERVADGLHIPGARFRLAPRPWEAPATSTAVHTEKAAARLGDASSEWGDDGDEDDLNRRDLLRTVSIASVALSSSTVINGSTADELKRVEGEARSTDELEGFSALNAHLWRVFMLSRANKRLVLPLVRNQLEVLTASITHTKSTTAHSRFCGLISDLLQLAGEISFDSNRYMEAAHCYTLAATAAKEASAHDLWACALSFFGRDRFG
jgi:hypothetical protein